MRESGHLQRKDKHHCSFPLQCGGEFQELICASSEKISVQEYLTSEFSRTKLPQYHINRERAHLQLARSCMCYISVVLNNSRGPDGSNNSSAFSESKIPIHPISHRLLDYVLEVALDHFRYIWSQTESVLHDIKVLAEDIERHSQVWDNMCLGTTWVADSTTPSWPVSSHDLPLYILVAFAPASLLQTYLPRHVLEPKKGTNPLVYAAYFNKHEQARTLLSRGAKLNCRGWETDGSFQALPIEVALRNGHHSMATFFVVEGSIVSPQIFTRLLSHHYGMIPSSVKRILLQTDDFVEAVDDVLNDPGPRLLNSFNAFLIEGIHGQDLILILRRMIQVSHDLFRSNQCGNEPFRLSPNEGTCQSHSSSTPFSISQWSVFVKTMFWRP